MGKKTLKFIYEKSDDYREFTVDGMFGGVSPYGLLQAYLTEETINIPEDELYNIIDGGRLEKKDSTNIENIVKKSVHAKINIPRETIPSIVEWLNAKYDEYKEIKKGNY
ncbi:MAG TPA: hypothetical protein VK031_07290 [Tissierellaceae bacterium]|nr:hypothetical protein [Tissierellaceae bacterium]